MIQPIFMNSEETERLMKGRINKSLKIKIGNKKDTMLLPPFPEKFGV
jgi:hypothetical protein